MIVKSLLLGLFFFLVSFMLIAQETDVPQAPEGFVLVEAGSFYMGSNSTPEADVAEYEGEVDYYIIEHPSHPVTITRSFYIKQHEVTQKEWEYVTGKNPFYPKGENLAVCDISWYDAVNYCNSLSLMEGLEPCYSIDKNQKDENNNSDNDSLKWIVVCNFLADGYRLPTEAEWEFAARGGNSGKNFIFAGSNSVDEVGWHTNNTDNGIPSVGQLKPNELGIFDMSGNVSEWCWDWFGIYNDSPQTDPTGPSSGDARIRRGGQYNFVSRACRLSARDYTTPSAPPMLMDWLYGVAGLRPVRTAE